jgi:hypothetical protein
LIREKLKNPSIRDRKVRFTYRIGTETSSFTIQDEGQGFDWKNHLADTQGKLELHGHGIKMTNLYVENLRYNDRGNEVSFDIHHQTEKGEIVPGLFANQEEVNLRMGKRYFLKEKK